MAIIVPNNGLQAMNWALCGNLTNTLRVQQAKVHLFTAVEGGTLGPFTLPENLNDPVLAGYDPLGISLATPANQGIVSLADLLRFAALTFSTTDATGSVVLGYYVQGVDAATADSCLWAEMLTAPTLFKLGAPNNIAFTPALSMGLFSDSIIVPNQGLQALNLIMAAALTNNAGPGTCQVQCKVRLYTACTTGGGLGPTTVIGDFTEVVNGAGYTTGGINLAAPTVDQGINISDQDSVTFNPVSWSLTGAASAVLGYYVFCPSTSPFGADAVLWACPFPSSIARAGAVTVPFTPALNMMQRAA